VRLCFGTSFSFADDSSVSEKLWIQKIFGAFFNLVAVAVKQRIRVNFGTISSLTVNLWLQIFFGACLSFSGAVADSTDPEGFWCQF
jgi:hypothetical protein